VLAHLDEFLRDIEECRIPDLRAQLEPLESGKIRIGEIRDGVHVDTTQARILWLERWIADYEAIASKLRGMIPIFQTVPLLAIGAACKRGCVR
jgi:hypothetical protein